jgi:GNAT superfamily N-acetyltransferase
MTVYYLEDKDLTIRSMEQVDAKAFHMAFSLQGWHKPIELFSNYYSQQENDEKKVIVAEVGGNVAGYVTLLPEATTGPFALQNIPEIVDFNVLEKYQRRGIGSKILDVAEQLARQHCCCVSLGVGLHHGYGSAQRMYIKRGYIPDGSGVWYQNKQLEQYALCVNDDDLILYMKKYF